MKDFKNKILLLQEEQYETENLYTINWIDLDTIIQANKIREKLYEKYDVYLDLIFIVLIGMEYTPDFMGCNTCSIPEELFYSFEKWLIDKVLSN